MAEDWDGSPRLQSLSKDAWAGVGTPVTRPDDQDSGNEMESETAFEPEVMVPQTTYFTQLNNVPTFPDWQPGEHGDLDGLVELPFRTEQSSFLMVERHVVTTFKGAAYGGFLLAQLPPPGAARRSQQKLQVLGYIPPGNRETVQRLEKERPKMPTVVARTCAIQAANSQGPLSMTEAGLLAVPAETQAGTTTRETNQDEDVSSWFWNLLGWGREDGKGGGGRDVKLDQNTKRNLAAKMERHVKGMNEEFERCEALMQHIRKALEVVDERHRWLQASTKEHTQALHALSDVLDNAVSGQNACLELLEQRTQTGRRILYSIDELNKSGHKRARLAEYISDIMSLESETLEEVVLPDVSNLSSLALPFRVPIQQHRQIPQRRQNSELPSQEQLGVREQELEEMSVKELDAMVVGMYVHAQTVKNRLDKALKEQDILSNAMIKAVGECEKMQTALEVMGPKVEALVTALQQNQAKLDTAKPRHEKTRKALHAVKQVAAKGGRNVDLQVTAAIYAAFLSFEDQENGNLCK